MCIKSKGMKIYNDHFLKYHGQGTIDKVKVVDTQIETLDRKDKRKLMSIIRLRPYMSKDVYTSNVVYIDSMGGKMKDTLTDTKIVHDIYDKLGIGDIDRKCHWVYYKYEQFYLHADTKKMAKEPRKDNKSYINYGNRDGRMGIIRYPSKKRKTAWKRFYKLFPHLDPKNKVE